MCFAKMAFRFSVVVSLLMLLSIFQDSVGLTQHPDAEDVANAAEWERGLFHQHISTTALKKELLKIQKETKAQAQQLSTLRSELEKVKKSCSSGREKVAFSAALGLPAGLRGPVGSETTIVYKNVLTNVGNAYNPATGIFTAPFKGVYYIRFTGSVYDNKSSNMGVNLYKNGHHLMHLGENGFDGVAKHASSGVTMELVRGDQVYTRLPANYVLWDDSYFRTSFSGFFLFPM
ncbi:complement C1q-like protein 4 [Astyanax mexicanus]|uniref:Collagen type VIII alpha 2 chain n=1 Tax=Astyanax mexicanus TaxID=7994 RepID=A0A8B9K5U6_ASTMX|nr:complement C1q-like protein 4 [Astyanax mexicanus]